MTAEDQPVRSVIIDDEAAGRRMLRRLLELHCREIRVVADADSAESGRRIIDEFRPDLVFLDVEMPHEDGFSMLDRIGSRRFGVVFVSAHRRHAMRAMQYSALDYLLKPVDASELKFAVRKALESRQKPGRRSTPHGFTSNGKEQR